MQAKRVSVTGRDFRLSTVLRRPPDPDLHVAIRVRLCASPVGR
jgi:hypothetical protein